MAKLTAEEKARRALNRRRKEAMEAEDEQLRYESKRREWDANGAWLTHAEMLAGQPCRGCGRPLIEGHELGPTERAEAEADFKTRHPDCRRGQWTMEGSGTLHCNLCCPPPPLSPQQIEKLSAIFAGAGTRRPEETDTWRLTLTCDHVVEKQQHRSNTYWVSGVATCDECEQTRGIVTKEKLPPSEARRRADQGRIAAELEKARDEHERLARKADAARRRVAKLEDQVVDLDRPDRL